MLGFMIMSGPTPGIHSENEGLFEIEPVEHI